VDTAAADGVADAVAEGADAGSAQVGLAGPSIRAMT
jgi:hypothetical protein